ncbi:PP2C family protein-serine/threonine phosphatase [uncultured Litoreibacter sp.]|uniref:PP2C family protein-serine/threonine phosphatase n=1 Tax=uncultured Litoreibacter sp. TaxID=1392394 RepID=UPI002613BCC8|nr:fused response regulator/phosphatase [uncultured Litoreibacter sp.]
MSRASLFPIQDIPTPDLWDDEGVTNPDAPPLVLVVDDSAMQRAMLMKSLSKWGYDVLEAESAMDGLAICREHDITMVISDWMMPGMNGPEFCHAFRQLERESYGYFILLTSKAESREVAEGLNSGADDFLTKPFVFGELKARLRAGERIVAMHSQLVQKNRVLNNALTTIQSLYDNVERDLSEARRLQESLVPETEVEFGRGRAALMLKPSGHVGGDLVGQFRVSDTMVGLFSLDVSGHGVASALMTARLAGYLCGQSPTQNIALVDQGHGVFVARNPAETVKLLNQTLLREMETDHYFTMALAMVDLKTGRMNCVQAGHPHPMILRADGQIEELGGGGMPIGLLPDARYDSFNAKLRPNDKLILYSDGVTEAENPQGEPLDEAGLIGMLQRTPGRDGAEILNDVLVDLEVFCGTSEFSDDVSGLIFEYDG